MSNYSNLINHIESVIRDEAKHTRNGYSLNWEDLDNQSQDKIVSLFIEQDDRELSALHDNKNHDDMVCALLKMLNKNDHDSEEDFIKCVKKNLVSYYASRAQEMIDDRLAWVEKEDFAEHGLYKKQDPINGEFTYSHI